MEHFLTTKRNEILTLGYNTNLKNIMLNERSQSQRPHIVRFHLKVQNRQIYKDRK